LRTRPGGPNLWGDLQSGLFEAETVEVAVEAGVEQPHSFAVGTHPFGGEFVVVGSAVFSIAHGPVAVVIDCGPGAPGLGGIEDAEGGGVRACAAGGAVRGCEDVSFERCVVVDCDSLGAVAVGEDGPALIYAWRPSWFAGGDKAGEEFVPASVGDLILGDSGENDVGRVAISAVVGLRDDIDIVVPCSLVVLSELDELGAAEGIGEMPVGPFPVAEASLELVKSSEPGGS